MMKIIKNNNNKYKYIASVAVIIVLGLVILFSYLYIHNSPDRQKSTLSSDSSKSASTKSDTGQSSQVQDKSLNKNTSTNTDQPALIEKDEVTKRGIVQVVASANTSNGTVYIRGGINSPVLESGGCYAILSGPTGQSIRKDAIVLQNPASTDCKTIAVPTSELVTGQWTFILYYSSDNYEGASNEVTFSI